jgi:hypothetical protein
MFAVTSQDWTPLDETERATVEHYINEVQTEAFRKLVPDSGAYINEVYPSVYILLVECSLMG